MSNLVLHCNSIEYYQMVDLAEQMTPAGDFVPTDEELNTIFFPKCTKDRYFFFLFWIEQTGTETDANRFLRRQIHHFIKTHLVIDPVR